MHTITIIVEGGVVVDVLNMPEDMTFEVCDHDDCEIGEGVHKEACRNQAE